MSDEPQHGYTKSGQPVHALTTDYHKAGTFFQKINSKFGLKVTLAVGTMWCAYLFAVIAFISLPMAIKGGTASLISWIAQTFLQLVLLSVIMVGQKVAALASDKQAEQTYKDTESILKLQDEIHRLIKINNTLTEEIHSSIVKK